MSDTCLSKTKKRKKSSIDKKELWRKFDIAKEGFDDAKPLECVYTKAEDGKTLTLNAKAELRSECECCGSILIVGDEKFLICKNPKCGIIYKDCIDQTAEWRYYGGEGSAPDPARAGAPINELLHESSFGCRVLCARGGTYEMRKIRRYTDWQSMPYREKALYDEFQRISALGKEAGLSKMIIDSAFHYHKKLAEARTFRGLNRDGIIAASIYIAARINNCPRTPKEIAQIFRLDNASATRGCKNAVSIINTLECDIDNDGQTKLCETTPMAFIERYCSKLGMSRELTKLCCFISMRIQQNDLVPENTPCAIAAGVIYFVAHVCKIGLTKRSIHKVSSISEVTINKCFKKLESLRNDLIPRSIQDKYAPPSQPVEYTASEQQ